ncbi:MAG: ComEC/Rec2 family competence protein [Rhodospirillaceae bacterium]
MRPYAAWGEFRQELKQQEGRAILWIVVAFAAGVALFFGWREDPSVWLGPIAAVGAIVLLRLRIAKPLAIAIIAIAAGHSAAHFRTALVATPLLTKEIGPVDITGRVVETERRPGVNRIVLAPTRLPRVPEGAIPKRLRINIPRGHGLPQTAAMITVPAVVGPAMRPAIPDGFQFQRFLYFEEIGGTGYSVGRWELTAESGAPTWRSRFTALTEGWRRKIGARVAEAVPGDAGTVATALINGEQTVIPEPLQDAYRAAGLAHLLSISGFHMTLLAGAVFFLIRRMLALIPAIALRTDTKKIAAWCALALTFGYLLISGLSVPAVRAFLMIAVVLTAVLLDRTALSLRTIAWAALVLMLVYPDAVFGASFQMSFVAVLALIALYEQTWLKIPWRDAKGEFSLVRAVGVYVLALVVTDLVAGGATNIFALYHFNKFPTYSLAANLIAGPLTGLWIMPAGALGVALMPVGLDAIPLRMMGTGIDILDAIVLEIASWPNAQVHVPPMKTAFLLLAASGMIFICLWKGRLRWVGVVPVLAALIQPWVTKAPDILVDESARVIAVSDANGHLVFAPGRAGRFVREVWTERYGASEAKWPGGDMACDKSGCVLTRGEKKVLLAFDPAALAEDCGEVDVIVSTVAAYDLCTEGFIIDRINLARKGTHALWVSEEGITARSAADAVGARVWMRGSVGLALFGESASADEDGQR